MWYSGDDGTTSRILAALQPPGGAWERLGIAVDAGFAGDTDSYGAESPCVVKTPGGYLMVYGGFDGEVSRLHMATSDDASRWDAQGTIMQRGPEDVGGASHPCVLIAGERWWLFFTGYRGSSGTERSELVAAVSQTGASRNRARSRCRTPVCSMSRGPSTCSMRATSEVRSASRSPARPTASRGTVGARSWNLRARGQTAWASTPRV